MNKNDKINGPDFTERIDQILDYKCISRRELAAACGFSTPNIARWKTQGSLPDVGIGVKIADYLEVPLYWLVTGEKEKTTSKEITGDEAHILEVYRSLTPADQNFVTAMMKVIAQRYKDEQEEEVL